MYMTTNTLWTSPSSENLADLTGLTDYDANLLIALEPFATAVAPAFQEAVFSRLSQNLLYASPLEYKLGKTALEKWFVHLFHNAETLGNIHPCGERHIAHLHRKSGIPFRYLLSLLEVIHNFGKRVTQNSAEPERAFAAFQKVLGLEFALNQVYEEMYVSHLSELMLDD